MFFPVGTDRPARRRPAALDRPGSLPSLFTVRPGWAVLVSAAYNLYADALFQGDRRSPASLRSQEISTGRCLCHISPRACLARRAPPSPRVTRGTTLPAAAVAAAAALRAAPRCAGPSVRLRVALVPRPPGPFSSGRAPFSCTCIGLIASFSAMSRPLQCVASHGDGCCRVSIRAELSVRQYPNRPIPRPPWVAP